MSAKKSFNPYDVLGVPKDADDEDIKKAYRKKAKKAHPDTGGSAEAFETINRANLILRNPVTRSKFDRDGTVDDETIHNAMSAIIGIILTAFFEQMNAMVSQNVDPTTQDLMSRVRQTIGHTVARMKENIRAGEKRIAQQQRIADRVKFKKKGENLIRRAIESQVAEGNRQLANNRVMLADYEAAIVMLDDYEFQFDAPPPQYGYASSTTGGGWLPPSLGSRF